MEILIMAICFISACVVMSTSKLHEKIRGLSKPNRKNITDDFDPDYEYWDRMNNL